MGTLTEHEAEILAGEDLITRFTAALASSKVRTAGNIRDLRFGIARGKAEIKMALESIAFHEQGFDDTQILFYFTEIRKLKLWTGLLLGTCSGCTAGKINLAFDVTNMYRAVYNPLVEMGFSSALEADPAILSPAQVASINGLGLSEWKKIEAQVETISERLEPNPDPVPETNIVPIEAGVINDQDVNFENSFIQTELGRAEEIGIDDRPELPIQLPTQEQKADVKNIILPLAALFIASGG